MSGSSRSAVWNERPERRTGQLVQRHHLVAADEREIEVARAGASESNGAPSFQRWSGDRAAAQDDPVPGGSPGGRCPRTRSNRSWLPPNARRITFSRFCSVVSSSAAELGSCFSTVPSCSAVCNPCADLQLGQRWSRTGDECARVPSAGRRHLPHQPGREPRRCPETGTEAARCEGPQPPRGRGQRDCFLDLIGEQRFSVCLRVLRTGRQEPRCRGSSRHDGEGYARVLADEVSEPLQQRVCRPAVDIRMLHELAHTVGSVSQTNSAPQQATEIWSRRHSITEAAPALRPRACCMGPCAPPVLSAATPEGVRTNRQSSGSSHPECGASVRT